MGVAERHREDVHAPQVKRQQLFFLSFHSRRAVGELMSTLVHRSHWCTAVSVRQILTVFFFFPIGLVVVVPLARVAREVVCQLVPTTVFRCTPVSLSSLYPCQVKYIRKNHGDYFGISVAGYPEGHPNRIKEVGLYCT